MGTKYWGGIGVVAASIVAGVSAASAADLAVKAPAYKAPPPIILSDWAGFYIGVNGGYGWGDFKNDAGFSDKPKGGLFGGHAGYNWQYGSVVAGVEVDFDGADIKDTKPATIATANGPVAGTVTPKFDELATARARLGYLVLPNLLAYGTAGPGWGHSEVHAVDTAGATISDAGATNFGWTAGAGLEYKFYGNFTARAEYLHYDFAKEGNNKTTIDTVRGGLSYKF
jgi:outer membrane immunogenic protein